MDHAVGLHPALGVHRERRSAKEPPERRRRAARLGEARRPLGQLHGRPCARALLARARRTSTCSTPTGGASAGRGAIDNKGPTLGQLGFGVLGAGFSGGMMYAHAFVRRPAARRRRLRRRSSSRASATGRARSTARPEAELTFERTFSDGWGKVALFGNGVYQKVYKDGYCTPNIPNPETSSISPATRRSWARSRRRPSRARPLSPRCVRLLRPGAGAQLRPRGQRGRPGRAGQPAQEQGRLRAGPGRRRKGRPVRRLRDREDRPHRLRPGRPRCRILATPRIPTRGLTRTRSSSNRSASTPASSTT